MTIKTSQILTAIANCQAKIDFLNDAANQLALLEKHMASLQAQITPADEPDASAVAFVAAQVTSAKAKLASACAAHAGAK